MSVRYIFNTKGNYIAFSTGEHVFTPDCEWVGFIPSGNEVYDTDGAYMGQISDDDRLIRKRNEPRRPKLMRPMRPLKPVRPIRPMRRLRMPRLTAGYEDVFEHGEHGSPVSASANQLDHLYGSSIIAHDGTFLGTITRNRLDPKSVLNQFGEHGSRYSRTSIFNRFGAYGNPFSQLSPFARFSTTPPRIELNGQLVGYLAANQTIQPRIDPQAFIAWLGSLDSARSTS